MFKVTAVEKKSLQEEICAACRTEYLPEAFAYAAFGTASPDDETGDIIGICQFTFIGGCSIKCLAPADGKESDEAMLILGFAVLEFLRRCGFDSVTANLCPEYAYKLGFKKENGIFNLNLTAPRACGGHYQK